MSQFSTLLAGAAVTLEVSFLATLLGALVGVVVAVLFQTKFSSLRFVIRLYVSFARGTPLFIQILIVYFLLPRVGLDVSRFYAGVIALAFNSGAYISEMIRGAITMVPRGQNLALPKRPGSLPGAGEWPDRRGGGDDTGHQRSDEEATGYIRDRRNDR